MGPITRLIKRYLSWVVWDFLIVLASIGVSGVVVRLFGPLNIGLLWAIEIALGCAVLYSVVGVFLHTNRINWTKASSWESVRLWASWVIATIAILGFHYYLGSTSLRMYGVILGASTLSLVGIIIVRYWKRLASGLASRLLTHQPRVHTIRERVLIVGSGRTAEHISWLMDHPTYSEKISNRWVY